MAERLGPGALRDAIHQREWYHSIELAPGLVTPGWFDLRSIAPRVPIPRDLTGQRCLDVGTFDGFWAFEMERRGASEVVAVDVPDPSEWDWPVATPASVREKISGRHRGGDGFDLAHGTLQSSVRRDRHSVYDLDPAALGTFDLVYVGSLLIHLRDPVGALEAVRSVCAGQAVFVDTIDPWLSVRYPRRPLAELDGHNRPWWWRPNLAAARRMVEAAGFALIDPPTRLLLPRGAGQPPVAFTPRVLRSRAAREVFINSRLGDLHVVLNARPAM